MRTRIGHLAWQVGIQNIFIKLWSATLGTSKQNKKIKREREREEEEEEEGIEMENREPREELMRRKIWVKRKRGQLRKKNEKLLEFNVFYFSLFYSKSPLNWGLWVFFF